MLVSKNNQLEEFRKTVLKIMFCGFCWCLLILFFFLNLPYWALRNVEFRVDLKTHHTY